MDDGSYQRISMETKSEREKNTRVRMAKEDNESERERQEEKGTVGDLADGIRVVGLEVLLVLDSVFDDEANDGDLILLALTVRSADRLALDGARLVL